MTHRKVMGSRNDEPFHDTLSMYIGVTKNVEMAEMMEAHDTALIRLPQHRWPREIRSLKQSINFVLKEAGEQNFLVVVNE